MIWNKHYNLKNRHAVLAPSNHSWKNYDDNKLISSYEGNKRKIEGTELHEWAEELIKSITLTRKIHAEKSKRTFNIDIDAIRMYGEEVPLVRDSKAKETVFMYIADAIKFDMVAEQPLSYDDSYCFGTADAIQFDGYLLRIHDLKTGETPASIDQLVTYAALFCLEYNHDPKSLMIELRIYQTDQIMIYKPTCDEVIAMMNIIIHDVDVLRRYERGEL